MFPDNDVALALSKSEISLPAGQGSQRSARRFGESRGCPPRRSHRTSRRVPCRRRPDAGIVAPRGDAEPPSPTPTFGGVVVIVRSSQQPDRATTTTTTHPPSRRPAGTRSSPLSSRSPVRPVPKRTFRPRLSPRPPSRAFVGVRVNPESSEVLTRSRRSSLRRRRVRGRAGVRRRDPQAARGPPRRHRGRHRGGPEQRIPARPEDLLREPTGASAGQRDVSRQAEAKGFFGRRRVPAADRADRR